MAIYIALLIISCALGFFLRRPVKAMGVSRANLSDIILMSLIFLLLFGVSASRIAVGNDYWVYRDLFGLISQHRYVPTEFGFNLTVRALQLLFGKDEYLIIFGVFSFFTVLFFLKAIWDQSESIVYSIFLLLSAGYYFYSFTNVRYYFALAIAVYAASYVIKKDYTRFILMILLASAFHKSVLVVIPLYWIATYKWKRFHIILGMVLILQFVLLKDLYKEVMFFFYPDYKGSVFDKWEISWANLAKSIGVLALCLLYYKDAIKDNIKNRFYFNISIFAFLVYSVGSFIPQTSRIGFYLNIYSIFLIPSVLKRIKNKKQQLFFTISITCAFLLYFAMFLRGGYDVNIRILPYLTWIFD